MENVDPWSIKRDGAFAGNIIQTEDNPHLFEDNFVDRKSNSHEKLPDSIQYLASLGKFILF